MSLFYKTIHKQKTEPSFLNENEREMTGEKQNICEMI